MYDNVDDDVSVDDTVDEDGEVDDDDCDDGDDDDDGDDGDDDDDDDEGVSSCSTHDMFCFCLRAPNLVFSAFLRFFFVHQIVLFFAFVHSPYHVCFCVFSCTVLLRGYMVMLCRVCAEEFNMICPTPILRKRLPLSPGSWISRYLAAPDVCDKGNFARMLRTAQDLCCPDPDETCGVDQKNGGRFL